MDRTIFEAVSMPYIHIQSAQIDHLEPFVIGATIYPKIGPGSSDWLRASMRSVRLGALALVRLSSEPPGRFLALIRQAPAVVHPASASEKSYFGGICKRLGEICIKVLTMALADKNLPGTKIVQTDGLRKMRNGLTECMM